MTRLVLALLSFGVACLTSATLLFSQEPNPSELEGLTPKDLLATFDESRSQSVRQATVHQLIRRRTESLPALQEAAMKGTEDQKLLALRLLSEMRYEKAAELAIAALADPSIKVQRRACTALMGLKSTPAYPHLIRVLRDSKDTGVIKSAVAALGQIEARKAIPIIRPFLAHENDSVRVNAAVALASLGTEEALDTVIALIHSGDIQAQREAIYGLGYFRNTKATEAAQAIIDSPTGRWKSEAHIALAQQKLSAVSPDIDIRRSFLQNLLSHQNSGVRLWAVDELLTTNDPAAVAAIRAIARQQTREGQHAARKLDARGITRE